MKTFLISAAFPVIAVTLFALTASPARAQQKNADLKPVAWDTFVRAESDKYFKSYVDLGGFGKFFHIRKPTPIDAQSVIRMNRDTMYSFGVFDLTTPVTITKPDTGDRFQSMMVINQDEYLPVPVEYKPGTYTLTQEKVGTRYVMVGFRTFANANDPGDIKKVNAIQDQIKVEQESVGKFEIPNWDQKSQDRMRDALNVLASTLTDASKCFGTKDEVDPIAHLLGAAFGWGGNPAMDATYLNITPKKNDGKTPYALNVKDVPVDGFWSISLYNDKGFFQKNKYNAYSINNITGVKNEDGSYTIHFGGDPKQPNYLPIMDGWNYIVRLYKPQQEILDGKWKFPAAEPAK
ncbi:MAG: DUF1214 domain-containing protein [Acidimicrobiales bacterium]|nr:DUF1214 domain-containing protein [Acidimicrobiales bacterium]